MSAKRIVVAKIGRRDYHAALGDQIPADLGAFTSAESLEGRLGAPRTGGYRQPLSELREALVSLKNLDRLPAPTDDGSVMEAIWLTGKGNQGARPPPRIGPPPLGKGC